MSYLEGRKNIYSIISKEVVDYIKDEFSLNKQLNKYTQNGHITLEKDMYVSNTRNQSFTGIPQNLVTNTSLYTECGNDDNGVQCIECLKKFDITDADLLPNNYENNIEKINYIKNNQCSGACSCNISNVSLSSLEIVSLLNLAEFDVIFCLKILLEKNILSVTSRNKYLLN